MSEVERIKNQLECAFGGDAWHGASVKEVLAGVTAEEAAARPVASAHSIWEIVLHLTTWERVVRRRLIERIYIEPSDREDWPPVSASGEQAWKKALEELEQEHRALSEEISKLDDDGLEVQVVGKDYPVYVMLHGVIQHDLYHAGQIALLKKARRG